MSNLGKQKWVLLDFGDRGVDIESTDVIQFEDESKFNNECFDFKNADVIVHTCEKKNSRKKSSFDATVLEFGGTKEDLKGAMQRYLDGKPIDGGETPLGKGQRKGVRKRIWSDEESDADESNSTSGQTKKKQKSTKEKKKSDKAIAKELVDELVQEKKTSVQQRRERLESQDLDSDFEQNEEWRSSKPSFEELKSQLNAKEWEVRHLKKENKALRDSLSILEGLPELLTLLQNSCKKLKNSEDRSDTCLIMSPTAKAVSRTALLSPKSSQSTVIRPLTPIHKTPAKNGTHQLKLSMDDLEGLRSEDLTTPDGAVVVSKEKMRILNHTTPRKLINDLLIATFDQKTLKSSSLTGAVSNVHKNNSNITQKKPLCSKKVQVIQSYVIQVFGVDVSMLNTYIREKLVNESRPPKTKKCADAVLD